MDWKYKHFHSERTFPASRSEVVEAARAFFSESLGCQVAVTADGLEAKGASFAHVVIAKFHITSASDGTKATVELLVERASALGFMLFDVGGYYGIQIRHWFEGIERQLHRQLDSPSAPDSSTQISPKPPDSGLASRAFLRFLYLVVIGWLVILLTSFLVLPLIGLVTGHLYIPGRGSGGLTLHGGWARIVSAMILLLTGFIVWKSKRKSHASIRS